MIARIKEINPNFAALIFIFGLTHRQILSLLKSFISSFKKPAVNKQEQSVGIYITNTEYYIGVGVPIYNREHNIDDFLINNPKKGLLNKDPNITIQAIATQLEEKKHRFVGVSSVWNTDIYSRPQSTLISNEEEIEGWEHYPIIQNLKRHIKATQYGYQSSINANCLAEYKLGNHQGKSSLVFIDVGKEVTIGAIVGGKFLSGDQSQRGHIIVQRHPDEDPSYQGTCNRHSNCLQGYINIESIVKRCKTDVLRLHTIRSTDPVWKLIGFYLAQLCLNLTYLLSPQTIVINGEIMNKKEILEYTETHFLRLLNKYVDHQKLSQQRVRTYICKPKIISSGVKGCMLLKYPM